MREVNIEILTLRGRKHPHLIVKHPDKNEWESIAQLKVPVHEFWEKLGYGLGIKFVEKGE